jgi:hypothetical protein
MNLLIEKNEHVFEHRHYFLRSTINSFIRVFIANINALRFSHKTIVNKNIKYHFIEF